MAGRWSCGTADSPPGVGSGGLVGPVVCKARGGGLGAGSGVLLHPRELNRGSKAWGRR